MIRRIPLALILVVTAALWLCAPASAAPAQPLSTGWTWPVAAPIEMRAPYEQPAHRYASGHRGVDLTASGAVASPADGVVAFVGQVAGRSLITIAHAGDLVTTLEPVISDLGAGDPVHAGQQVGVVATGGHAATGTVHFGVRLRGEYVNPLSVMGEVPAAVLLPCCT